MSMSEAVFDQIPEQALAWYREGQGAALASVIQTWGSAPRPVGSQLAISGSGALMGSVSGGCVEGAVTAEALEAIAAQEPRVLEFGVADEDAFAVGLACGGTIRILVEPVGTAKGISEETLAELVADRATRNGVGRIVDLQTWENHLVGPELHAAAFAADKSGFVDDLEHKFLTVHNPPLRMAIIGAVHIAQALAPMARLAGYDVTVIDPRETFAAEHRFPGETIATDWPDEALEALGLDARMAVVCLTHDPKLDDPALRLALPSRAFYIGALGSTRTHAKRVQRLRDVGMSAEHIERLHAPVGADIGAQSPAEIAVSILAQITERLRRPQTRR
ncbi:MAG: XdhC/CoxI family protein [Neomegalonema sp.]|nr:XdhC/CoxI family protein [Neomegalonema sp.]